MRVRSKVSAAVLDALQKSFARGFVEDEPYDFAYEGVHEGTRLFPPMLPLFSGIVEDVAL